ncbi:MAG TPA: hypothetical protein VFF06_33210 [Polyangia bacterium]|nr:hypothetical protein [Polyangia bacterium]
MATLEKQIELIEKLTKEAAGLDAKVLSAARLYILSVNLTSLMQAETSAFEEAQQYESACGANLLNTLNDYIDARIAAALPKPDKA